MKYAPYSFSKLSTYKQCSRKFKYQYIDKLPVKFVETEALKKGKAIHKILEHYPIEVNTNNNYKEIANNFINSDLGKKYLNLESVREYKFGIDKQLNPCSYNDKSCLLRGFIDFICKINNELYLIDFKTGKYKDEKYQDYSQLLYYAIYFFQKEPNISKIKISYVYVEHDNLENIMELDRQYLDNYKIDLLKLINSAEYDTSFNKTKTKLCDYCNFLDFCQKD